MCCCCRKSGERMRHISGIMACKSAGAHEVKKPSMSHAALLRTKGIKDLDLIRAGWTAPATLENTSLQGFRARPVNECAWDDRCRAHSNAPVV